MTMKKISECRVCKNKNIREFFNLGNQPFANSLLKTPNEKEKFYPLSLSWCPNCNLVQLNHTADPKELFSNYVWVTATSKTAKEYAVIFYKEILSRTENLHEGYTLEVASNDGTFLIPFIENGYKALGVDPAKNIADKAIREGVSTICGFFGEELAREIIREYGYAQVVFARNVLPHVANLHDFIKGLRLCLEDEGLLVLEVHYAEKICEELHYDSIYHEHLCYFTLKSIEQLINQYGLFIFDIEKSPISGGSLVLYIKKNKTEEKPIVQSYREVEKEIELNELSSWEEFAKKAYSHREELLKIMNNLRKEDKIIVGYGASARSSTLLNFCGIDTKFISMIADQNPLKQGFYTAGTHIPIDSPEKVMEKNPDCVFILAWNFADEIIDILRGRINYTGKCIIPLPNNPKILRIYK